MKLWLKDEMTLHPFVQDIYDQVAIMADLAEQLCDKQQTDYNAKLQNGTIRGYFSRVENVCTLYKQYGVGIPTWFLVKKSINK